MPLILFIACTPPARSPTEHVFTVKDEDGDSEGCQKLGMCMLPEEVLPRVLLEQNVYVRIPKLTTSSLQVQQFLLPFRP